MPACKKTPQVTRYDTPADLPAAVQAAGIALAILKAAKVQDWVELASLLGGRPLAEIGVELDAAQIELIDDNKDVLPFLRTSPNVTVAACRDCGEFVAVAGTPPTKCRMTDGCTGKMLKAAAAKKVKNTAS